jgi:hypothetical protein
MKQTNVARKNCGKKFDTVQALNLHTYRMHTHRGRRQGKKIGQANRRRIGEKRTKHAATNGMHAATLADLTAKYKRAAEIAAALAFLSQFGTVDYKETVV